MNNKKILVAVIAYNEEENIGTTIIDLQKYNFGYDIVVIDNASTDRTAAIAKELGIDVLSHCVNTGGGMGTVTTYMAYGYENGYDCICQFDGDGQHIASELKNIVEPILSGVADYVIGSRFINKEGFQSTALRRIGIVLFSSILSYIMKQKITDSTSGFRAYDRDVMKIFCVKDRIQLADVNQLLLISHFDGARIMEVPVIMKERVAGESEFNFINSVKFILNGFVSILGTYIQRKNYSAGAN